MWPNTPPPLPLVAYAGPIGLWTGGAFVSYELADGQNLFYDERLRHPPMRASEDLWSADERRYERWQAEYRSQRGETYLRLTQLDLADVDAILDFVSTFNVLDLRALDAPRLERQWYGTAPPRATPMRILRHYPGFGDGRSGSADSWGGLRERVITICEAERKAAPVWMISETLEEFRWGARAIRDLHTAWCCLREGIDPREARWANSRMPSPTDGADLAVSVTASFLENTVSDALQGFSPRMWLIDDRNTRRFQGAPTRPEPRDVTMFEVLVLELFRHIVEDASYKRCANPQCQRLFVRQEGGAAHGQSRMTGVMYCTRRCAKAVAQRRYRQRRASR